MTLLRKIASLVFAALSVLLALGAFILGFSTGGVANTVQHAHEIEKSFTLVSVFVESFKKTNGHLPTESEFTAWAVTVDGGQNPLKYAGKQLASNRAT